MGKKVLIFTVIFMSAGLLVAGCGGNGGGKNSSSAQTILDQALKNLGALKSFKATMKITQAPGSSSPTAGSRVDVEVNNAGDGAMHSVMDYGGTKVEGYQIGDTTYSFQEGQGWLKQTGAKTESLNVNIANSLKTGIKDLKIQSQDASSYRLAFKWAEPAQSSQNGSTPSSTSPSGATQKFVVKVDKPTMNIQEMSIKASATGSSGNEAQEEVLTFSELNKPITITLPEEAKNAKSAQETQQSAP